MAIREAILGSAVATVAVALSTAPTSFAQQPQDIGQFGEWTAYTVGTGTEKYCYIVSSPEQASLRGSRDRIFYLVWHNPSTGEFDVVQINIGYVFEKGSKVEVAIGGRTWELFTDAGNAWASTSQDDAAIVQAMRRGLRMTVTGVSSKGNKTTDVYSLIGVTASHNAINRACQR